jgi:hypothetical protein
VLGAADAAIGDDAAVQRAAPEVQGGHGATDAVIADGAAVQNAMPGAQEVPGAADAAIDDDAAVQRAAPEAQGGLNAADALFALALRTSARVNCSSSGVSSTKVGGLCSRRRPRVGEGEEGLFT